MLHSCPLHAAPTLSKALTLPPSPSSLLPRCSARRVQWIQLVFIPLLLWWWAYSTHQTRRIFLSLAPSTGRMRGPSDLFPLLFWQSGASSFWSANTAELLPTRWCQQTPVNTEAEFAVSNRPELILQSSSWSQRDLGWGWIGVSVLLSCIYVFLQVYISVCMRLRAQSPRRSSTRRSSPVTTLSGDGRLCHSGWHSSPINQRKGRLMKSLCILRVSSWHPLLALETVTEIRSQRLKDIVLID